MSRSFTSSWIKTALPIISTCSMTSFVSGRTTTITTDHTEPSMGRLPTSGSWQRNVLPACHRSPETLHESIGGKGGTRTLDPGIMSAVCRGQVSDFSTSGQTAVAAKCLKVHRRAGENPADLPRARMYCCEQTSRLCAPLLPLLECWLVLRRVVFGVCHYR